MKKIISLLVTCIMLLSVFSAFSLSASAAETYSGTWGNLTWTLDTVSGELVISGEGEMKDFLSSHSYVLDTAWRKYKESIKTVIINEGVTSISNYAFYDCRELTSVAMPQGITSISEDAFYICDKLTSINIPESVTSIGEYAFCHCSSLKSINIPDSVASIGEGAFGDCDRLTSISVDENNLNFKSIDGNLYSKDGKILIQYAIGKEDVSFEIPNGVTTIGNDAFFFSDLENVTIPDSVINIGHNAFGYCFALTGIILPQTVKNIEDYAFSNCDGLKSINIPDGVTNIGDSTFYKCSSLTNIDIPDSVTVIGVKAFSRCSALTSVNIPESVITVGEDAFDGCDKLIQKINGVFYVGKWVVDCYPSIESASISDSAEYISDSAFKFCFRMTEIIIPESIKSFGNSAFYDCKELEEITYCGTEEQWNNISKGTEWDYNIGASTEKGRYTLGFHKFGEGIITTEPTYDTEGVKSYTCVCGETKTEVIEKLEKPTETTDETTEVTNSSTTVSTISVSDKGCSSSLTFGAKFAILAAVAAALTVCKKKED